MADAAPATAPTRRPRWLMIVAFSAFCVAGGLRAIEDGHDRVGRANKAAFRAIALAVEGDVVGHHIGGRGTRFPIYRFAAPDGRVIEGRLQRNPQGHSPPVGMRVALLALPDQPDVFYTAEDMEDGPFIGMILMGAFFILLGVFSFLAFAVFTPLMRLSERRRARAPASP